MADEREIKLRVEDEKALKKTLTRMSAKPLGAGGGRVHEWNVIFDTPQGGLAKHGQLLRIRKETAQGVDWLQNRRIAALREHRIDRRPNERVGRYAFFLSERDQLRLFLRFQRQDDRHKLLSLHNSIAEFYMERTALANRLRRPSPLLHHPLPVSG